MLKILSNDIEEYFSNMPVEELLDIEEKIMKILKRKIREVKRDDWKKDFLEISVWSHLNDNKEIRVGQWRIEKF